jgi:DNA-binding IclR family transcriptional regulator
VSPSSYRERIPVKSAKRALDVFEYFASRRRPATVGEICAALTLPQSSTSLLLRSLHKLGYLRYSMRTRRYFPTDKFRALGEWIEPTINEPQT